MIYSGDELYGDEITSETRDEMYERWDAETDYAAIMDPDDEENDE